MVFRLVSSTQFENLGKSLMKRTRYGQSLRTRERRFIAWFGCEPALVVIVWSLLNASGWLAHLGPRSYKPVHLLWALMFLNRYDTEEVHTSNADCDEKTFRNWVWFYVEGIAELEQHVVSNSFLFCLCSVVPSCSSFRARTHTYFLSDSF